MQLGDFGMTMTPLEKTIALLLLVSVLQAAATTALGVNVWLACIFGGIVGYETVAFGIRRWLDT